MPLCAHSGFNNASPHGIYTTRHLHWTCIAHDTQYHSSPMIRQKVFEPFTHYNFGVLLIAEIDIEKCVRESIRLFRCTPKSASFRQHTRNAEAEKSDIKVTGIM